MNHPARQPRGTTTRLRGLRSPSWVEVDLSAVRSNVRALVKLLGPGCGLWAVVKADAYGHGAIPVSRAALAGGAQGLAVAAVSEGAALRRRGIRHPVLLFSPGEPGSANRVVRMGFIQTACRADMMEALSRAAQRLGKSAPVHLKVDTGMGRLGVAPEEAAAFARLLQNLPGVRLEGVFSQLATADNDDPRHAEEQFARFQRVLRDLCSAGISPGQRHLANSAATLRFPRMRLDAVRIGLLIYGIRPELPIAVDLDLRPALTWKARLAFLHKLPAGRSISYDRTYVTPSDTLVGVLPVGYADGYPRRASNRAYVLLKGRACPVIGRVCMDHVMVDATSAGDPQVGDEVTLIGRQGEHQVTANQLAHWAETCVHEVPTVIGPRVRRIYLDETPPEDAGADRRR